MEVFRKPFMGILMDPFARGARRFMLSSTGITVHGPDQRIVSFQDLSAPPSVTRTASRYMMLEAFALIDNKVIDPILSISTKAA